MTCDNNRPAAHARPARRARRALSAAARHPATGIVLRMLLQAAVRLLVDALTRW